MVEPVSTTIGVAALSVTVVHYLHDKNKAKPSTLDTITQAEGILEKTEAYLPPWQESLEQLTDISETDKQNEREAIKETRKKIVNLRTGAENYEKNKSHKLKDKLTRAVCGDPFPPRYLKQAKELHQTTSRRSNSAKTKLDMERSNASVSSSPTPSIQPGSSVSSFGDTHSTREQDVTEIPPEIKGGDDATRCELPPSPSSTSTWSGRTGLVSPRSLSPIASTHSAATASAQIVRSLLAQDPLGEACVSEAENMLIRMKTLHSV